MSARIGIGEKILEKFWYDFSLYNRFLKGRLEWNQWVGVRHILFLVTGFYVVNTIGWPYNPPFPTMGLCPKGYEGTFVCEPDKNKALEMYKEWKYGKKHAEAPAH
eukprot:jgi/Chrzof1/6961/Cz02g05180.t1